MAPFIYGRDVLYRVLRGLQRLTANQKKKLGRYCESHFAHLIQISIKLLMLDYEFVCFY